ncbi:hypothetical protein [Pseudonocardia sp. H11422]|uniref:hypothetical protein n=1 Tax=Pseudonocardia sp. H11422 TaxID=2835866 RepID=UPI001BDBFBFE|nr:hypothetical protein [Pseudonocardia sp. H11422]
MTAPALAFALLAAALALFVVFGELTAGLDRAAPAQWAPMGLALLVLLAGCLVGAGPAVARPVPCCSRWPSDWRTG